MKRIKFKKGPQGDDPLNKGPQRKFLKKVLEELNCPSLRALNQFGFDIPDTTYILIMPKQLYGPTAAFPFQ